jgi:hypothetical protein
VFRKVNIYLSIFGARPQFYEKISCIPLLKNLLKKLLAGGHIQKKQPANIAGC